MELSSSFIQDSELAISPEVILERYLFGIDLVTPSGKILLYNDFRFFIKEAQEEVEKLLNIKLIKTLILGEKQDYNLDDYRNFGYIRCRYPITYPVGLKGMFNNVEQLIYPKEWLSSKKSNDGFYKRNLYIIPNSGNSANSVTNNNVIFNGFFGANLLMKSRNYIPNYWNIDYITGFDSIPEDLLSVIGELAAINLLLLANDLILNVGLNSLSLSLDGISESKSTNGGFAARIKAYNDDIARKLPILKSQYRGLTFTTL